MIVVTRVRGGGVGGGGGSAERDGGVGDDAYEVRHGGGRALGHPAGGGLREGLRATTVVDSRGKKKERHGKSGRRRMEVTEKREREQIISF